MKINTHSFIDANKHSARRIESGHPYVDKHGGRLYSVPDGKGGECLYPSVTTILKLLSEDGIKKWRKRIGEEAADQIAQQAADRGEAVHELIENYILENTYTKPDPIMQYPIYSAFTKFKEFLDDQVNEVYGLECRLYSHNLEVAGTVDMVAVVNGKLSVVDFKTTRIRRNQDFYHHYFLQGMAYGVALSEREQLSIDQVVIVLAPDDVNTYIPMVDNNLAKVQDFRNLRTKFKMIHGV